MRTIYKIVGGGQKVCQNEQNNLSTEYIKVETSDYVEKASVCGHNAFASTMWHSDLESLQKWANEWAGKEVHLVETKE